MQESILVLVNDFKNGRIQRREFMKEAGNFILSIPCKFGYYDKDLKYEFYSYITSKIGKIILNYKEIENISFYVWFFTVLKRHFFYFVKKWKRNEDFHNKEVANILEKVNHSEEEYEEKKINLDISLLSKNEKKVVSLKYGINNPDKHEISKQILSRLDRMKRIENVISNKFIKLIRIQRNMINEYDKDKFMKLKEDEKKIIESKRKLEKILSKCNITPTNDWVANKMGITEGTVASYLHRIKNKMKSAGMENVVIKDE